MTRRSPYVGGVYKPTPLPVRIIGVIAPNGVPYAVFSDDYDMVSRRRGLLWTIPRTFTIDWASIPNLAQLRLNPWRKPLSPYRPWCWAAGLHDYECAVGEDQDRATEVFNEKLLEARPLGVSDDRRRSMTLAVDRFSGGAFRRAGLPGEWAKNFRDPLTGEHVPPPFERETAFLGGAHGPRPWSPA